MRGRGVGFASGAEEEGAKAGDSGGRVARRAEGGARMFAGKGVGRVDMAIAREAKPRSVSSAVECCEGRSTVVARRRRRARLR